MNQLETKIIVSGKQPMWERERGSFDIKTSLQDEISIFKVSALSAIGWFPDTMNLSKKLARVSFLTQ
jgi:hypothetical protein